MLFGRGACGKRHGKKENSVNDREKRFTLVRKNQHGSAIWCKKRVCCTGTRERKTSKKETQGKGGEAEGKPKDERGGCRSGDFEGTIPSLTTECIVTPLMEKILSSGSE